MREENKVLFLFAFAGLTAGIVLGYYFAKFPVVRNFPVKPEDVFFSKSAFIASITFPLLILSLLFLTHKKSLWSYSANKIFSILISVVFYMFGLSGGVIIYKGAELQYFPLFLPAILLATILNFFAAFLHSIIFTSIIAYIATKDMKKMRIPVALILIFLTSLASASTYSWSLWMS